jgi:hypothetical protein
MCILIYSLLNMESLTKEEILQLEYLLQGINQINQSLLLIGK